MPEGEDAFRLDRERLRAAFDRASAGYEASAQLQARVSAELLERLAALHLAPRVILDLGCGTGRVTRELKRCYPRALVIALDLSPGMLREARRHQRLWRRFARVCGDALRLPLGRASVDLVFSSLVLQWCEPLEQAFAEVRRVLSPEGFFAFSTLGPDTLKELRAPDGNGADPGPALHGTLRPYQKAGTQWLHLLCPALASVPAWPTTWASARQSRCYPCCWWKRRAAPGPSRACWWRQPPCWPTGQRRSKNSLPV